MLSCLPPPTLYMRSTRAAICRALRQASAADSALKLAIKFDPFREPWSNSLRSPPMDQARFHLPYLPASSVLQVWNILGPHVETISRRSIFQRGNLTGNPLSPVPQVPNLLVDPSIALSNSANVCASGRPPSTGEARTMKFLAQTIIAVDKFILGTRGPGRGMKFVSLFRRALARDPSRKSRGIRAAKNFAGVSCGLNKWRVRDAVASRAGITINLYYGNGVRRTDTSVKIRARGGRREDLQVEKYSFLVSTRLINRSGVASRTE